MPRHVIGKTTVKSSKKRERAKSYRPSLFNKFIDPFPLGFGTEPEKKVYEALSKRGIRFYYLNDLNINIPEIDLNQFFQADFILPDQRIIIEVQGAHWHSMPQTIESDALKFAYYEYTGWRALAWWDFDINNNINSLFLADPELSRYGAIHNVSSELTPMRRTKTDSSAGIRTLNRKRGQRMSYKKKPVTLKQRKAKVYGSSTTTSR